MYRYKDLQQMAVVCWPLIYKLTAVTVLEVMS